MTFPEFVAIGDICSVDSGPAFKSSQFLAENQGTRLLRGENIEPGALRWTKTRSWPDQLMDGYRHLLVEPGDLILGMDRPVVSSGLKLARVKREDCPALLVQRVARIKARNIDGRYLYHWLSAPEFSRHLQRTASGTQLPHVTLRSIREFAVPRFPSSVELRIVDILEDHLSHLDAADAGLADARQRSHALLKSHLWSTTHGAGERVLLTDVAEVRLGRQRSPSNHFGDRMVPYLRAANVDWDHLRLDDVKSMNFTAAEEQAYALREGDILLTEASGSASEVGKSAIYRDEVAVACFQNTLLRVRCHGANPDFIQKYLLAEAYAGRFVAESRGVGIHHLGRSRLANWTVELPDEHGQESAAAMADKALVSVRRLGAQIDQSVRRGRALRRALLATAFSGKLTERHTDQEVVEELVDE